MKQIIIFTFLSSLTLSFFPTKTTDFRLPGTVKIVDGFYFDAAEVSNVDWREYVSSLREVFGETSSVYLNALPNDSVWIQDGLNNELFANKYHHHPAYDYYPVVGISYDQVIAYCKWRTETVKTMLKRYRDDKVNFEYRLPTQTEWELVARGGYTEKQMKLIRKKNEEHGGKYRTLQYGF